MDRLTQDFQNGKLHHSIMITTVKDKYIYENILDLMVKILAEGVEIKKKIESFLDAEKSDEQEREEWTKGLIKNKEHTDFLLIERDPKDKEIKIETIKKINEFIQLTPFIAKNKVIVINGVNEMNIESQNGILKTIEEPQRNTYIFLICYNVNKVLTTVKSRCKIVNVPRINYDDWRTKVQNGTRELYDISNGSIDYANRVMDNDGLDIFIQIKNLLKEDVLNIAQLHSFADSLLRDDKKSEDRDRFDLYGFFTTLIQYYLYLLLKKKTVDVFSKKNSEKMLLEKYKTIQTIIRDTSVLNLDKKHSIIVMFMELSK
jgi:DNA polymerase III delta prime subunit